MTPEQLGLATLALLTIAAGVWVVRSALAAVDADRDRQVDETNRRQADDHERRNYR